MKKCFFLLLTSLVLFCTVASAQPENETNSQWKAYWITVPGASENGYGVYLFRRDFTTTDVPAHFIVHVSADNRYKFFINHVLVSAGPARNDLSHWNYETIDLAPLMRKGSNVVAAQVWNEGGYRPEGQISLQTGFILQGDAEASVLNTDTNWRCIQDSSYAPLPVHLRTYYVAGPGEFTDMRKHVSGWLDDSMDLSSAWKKPRLIFHGLPKEIMGNNSLPDGWMLVPSRLPQMERKEQRLQRTVRAEGVKVPEAFPAQASSFSVPAHTQATLLLDQGYLTNAYALLRFSGGREASISLSYAEALFTQYPKKGNRNETDHKIMLGRKDSVISNGEKGQIFESLNWRTYRYVQISILTKDEPLVVEDFHGLFTGYPFELRASFSSGDSFLKKVLETGWRTARLCAAETYMDCPYYEQLQYIGDTRIQGLVSLYNSGDDRLYKNAIDQIDHSRQAEGVTLSRHPSYTPQYIPTFSLWYIGMLHDYLMYGKDSVFVQRKLPGARMVLDYFMQHQDAEGSLKNVPHWLFTDWVEAKGWDGGTGPIGKDGSSSLLDLQLLWAFEIAADLEKKCGMDAYASLYLQRADILARTIRHKYWDAAQHLFADTQEKDVFSQHANTLAVLTGLVPEKELPEFGKNLLTQTLLAPASIYFKYYLHQALVKCGLGNDYVNWLGKWKENLDMGLTTWAEISDINQARSDCHAWGASPNIEIYRTILGIDSDAPGFTQVKIEPHMGALKFASGTIPHPNGKLSVSYQLVQGQCEAFISLPPHTTGRFIWKKRSYALHAGDNIFKM